MNGKERISRILKRQPVDRIGLFEHFWGDTYRKYIDGGHIKEGESFDDHFGFDLSMTWACNHTLDIDFKDEVVAEDEDTLTLKDGNGAILRRHKHHDTTPEHVDYSIKTRQEWDKVKHLLNENLERRINYDIYRERKAEADKAGRFFFWGGANVFELMHPIAGHEHMLIGMVEDPEWVAEMAETYAELLVKLQTILFEKEGYPDGMFYYEDMGFKDKPFMSPGMYKSLLQPSHKYTIDWAHKKGMPVIMHSCGFVEPLLPGMVEAGIDCLQVIEVKAGMDLLRIYENYGDKIALMGGIDVRTLYTNDRAVIDKELESKIPIVKKGYGFITHSDHSIPDTVEYETFQYYIKKALELGTY